MHLGSRSGVARLCSGLLALSASFVACGGGDGNPSGMGGSGGGGSGGGMGGGAGGAPACPGAVVMPTVDCPTTDIAAPSGTFPKPGACGEEGKATASACAYDGYEDLLVIDNTSFDTVCQIRFSVKRVGNAPGGCRHTNFATGMQEDCTWTQTVEYSNPMTMLDVNGACANSGYGLNSQKLAQLNGCRVAIGYFPGCEDHDGACRMKYYVSMGKWDVAPGGLGHCTAAGASAGECSPAGDFTYNPRTSCDFQ